MKRLAILAAAVAPFLGVQAVNKEVKDDLTLQPTDYVNVFVGTDGYGNVYPGAQTPFGGIQISPDTDEHFYDCASGYKWNRNSIQGFSLSHLSGTGIPDLGDFLFMAGTGTPKLQGGTDGLLWREATRLWSRCRNDGCRPRRNASLHISRHRLAGLCARRSRPHALAELRMGQCEGGE